MLNSLVPLHSENNSAVIHLHLNFPERSETTNHNDNSNSFIYRVLCAPKEQELFDFLWTFMDPNNLHALVVSWLAQQRVTVYPWSVWVSGYHFREICEEFVSEIRKGETGPP